MSYRPMLVPDILFRNDAFVQTTLNEVAYEHLNRTNFHNQSPRTGVFSFSPSAQRGDSGTRVFALRRLSKPGL